MAATATILTKGETLGGYRIDDIIGIGGMAIVYRAEQISLGRRVALKVLAPQLSHDEAFRERFRREGKHIAALDHPNVVAVHDSGEIDGRLYLAMRLVEGETLAARMLQGGLSAEQTLAVLEPIAEALDAAHALGLVHRDVKPQNILISESGHPYLADFGVAKGGQTTLDLTGTGGFIGSINYASPEQIRGEGTTFAGDIYALTAVLYQCLTGEVPYQRDTDWSVMQAHLNEPPPTLTAFAPILPELDLVIARGMAKEALARYSSARELIRAGSRALARLSQAQRRAVPAFAAAAPATVDKDEPVDDATEAVNRDATPATASIVPPAVEESRGSESPDTPTGPATSEGGGSGEVQAPEPDGAPHSSVPASRSADHGETEIVPARARRIRSAASGATTADRRRSAPPAEPQAPAHTGSRRVLLAGGGLVATAVIAIVAILALLGAGGSSGTRTHTARSGSFALTYTSSWRAAASPANASAFPAGQVVGDAAHFGANPAISLTAGHVVLAAGILKESAGIPGGAPPQLVAQYGQAEAATNATVAGAAGRVYTWSPSGESLVAYVIPGAQADAAIICKAATGTSLAACTNLATRGTTSGLQRVGPGPDGALRQALSLRLASVVSIRARLGGLGGSKLTDRAIKAQNLATAEARAAALVAVIGAPFRYRPPLARLSAALRREAAEFSTLAADARAGRRVAYTQTLSRVKAASAALRSASEALGGYGLAVPAFAALHLDAAPAPPRAHKQTSPSGVTPVKTQTPAPSQTQVPTPILPQTSTPTPRGGTKGGGHTYVTPFS